MLAENGPYPDRHHYHIPGTFRTDMKCTVIPVIKVYKLKSETLCTSPSISRMQHSHTRQPQILTPTFYSCQVFGQFSRKVKDTQEKILYIHTDTWKSL